MTTQLFTNNAVALLAANIGSTDTELTVQTGLGALFPQPVNSGDFFLVTLENITSPVIREILYITGRSGDVFTIGQRGFEGTTPTAWPATQTLVDHRITAYTINQAMLLPTGGGGGSLQLYSENDTIPYTPNSVTGPNAFAIGENNTVTGQNAFALGVSNNVTSYAGMAIGNGASATFPGQLAQANGTFAYTGDAQAGTYVYHGQTGNANPVELFMGGFGGSRLIMNDNSCIVFEAMIVGRRTGAGGIYGGFKIGGIIKRDSGAATTEVLGSPMVTIFGRNNTGLSAAIIADTTNGALVVQVVGVAGSLMNWVARLMTVEEVG